MSNITNCDSGSFSTENNTGEDAVKQQSEILGQFHSPNSHASTTTNNSNGSNTNSQLPPPVKKKRSLPGNPDPSAEVIALSPNSLVATNRFICEICDKGFRRDQNLQLHRRGHNLPWKLKQRASTEVRKRVYVCPETSCVHHNPARALGDLTGIKKHFSRKHGEKKWKCDKCSKKYAVQCDWKAHSKICGTKEYKCDCGTIFSRRDSFITHRAFCDALAEENKKVNEEDFTKMGNSNMQGQPIANQVASLAMNTNLNPQIATSSEFNNSDRKHPLSVLPQTLMMTMPATRPFNNNMAGAAVFTRSHSSSSSLPLQLSSNMSEENMNGLHLAAGLPHMSATALLQKAAQLGATVSDNNNTNGMSITGKSFVTSMAPPSFGETQQQFYGIMNQYNMHNAQQDFSSQYNFNANGMDGGSVGISGLDMFNAILDQSKALSKIVEHNSRSSNSVFRSSSTINVDGTKASEDVMTLDLLGIGGGGGGGGGAHGDLYGGAQPSETDARDEIWRNWSNNNSGFESFSATSSI